MVSFKFEVFVKVNLERAKSISLFSVFEKKFLEIHVNYSLIVIIFTFLFFLKEHSIMIS